MIIKRDQYLTQLIEGRHNGLIKIITGLRRCGKSFLLAKIFKNYLLDNGIEEDHIIHIPLDDIQYEALLEPHALLDYVALRTKGKGMYYILLDEVQMVENFVGVLNSFLHRDNIDVYATGSNSKFLSKDVVTEFRGRSDEIHMYPLSFAEFYSAVGGDVNNAWIDYYTYGGLPQIVTLNTPKKKMDYLSNLMQTVFIADVTERHRIKNRPELEELLNTVASAIGSPTNPTKLAKTFKSLKNITISNKTISKYLEYLNDAFIIEKAIRYNIKGKKYINTLSKYYFTDLGLRNAELSFRQLEQTHIMENVIFNELLVRGYRVDVGVVEVRETNKIGQKVRKQLEIDFVANDGFNRYYIQSAFAMNSDEKKAQETASFRNIDDSFRKVIIVRDRIQAYMDVNGYLNISLFDFLLNPNCLHNI